MPGLMVFDELPLIDTAPFDVPLTDGTARPANGSATAFAPVVGLGLSLPLPVTLSPPTIRMLEPVTEALPLTLTAVEELESTSTEPGTLIWALPDTVNAPLAVEFKT